MIKKLIKNKYFWRYLILVCMFIGTFSQYQVRAPKRNFSDFHVPYTVGNRLLAGEKIYSFEKGLSYFKYTPFYANLVIPLSVMPKRVAANFWWILNFVFIMFLFHCYRKILNPDKDYDPFLLYAVTLWMMFRFLLQNMHEGQANVFMISLLSLGLYFYTQKKRKLSAFFIAFAVMTKYMPILFLPYFLLMGEFALLGYVGVFIVLFNFFPVLSFGWAKTITLIQNQLGFLFKSSIDFSSMTNHANQSLLSLYVRFGWEKSLSPSKFFSFDLNTIFAAFIISALALYSMTVVFAWRKRDALDTKLGRWGLSLDWAMVFICMALFNPNAWMNFFACILFSYMVVIYYVIKCRCKDKLITVLLFISFVLSSWTSEEVVNWFAGDHFELFSSVTFGTFALFAALLILKIRNLKEQGVLK